MPRICESNSDECTGLNPCPYCYAFIFAKVLPGVVRAGGFPETQASADARFRAYDEGWKTALAERIAEKNAALPAPIEPYKTGTLTEFLAFKEVRRERLALKKTLEAQAGLDTKIETVPSVSDVGSNGIAEAVQTQSTVKGKPEKPSAKLVRGDLKRMAEKKAKQSLAPGNGIHGDSSNKTGADDPATGGTGRH